MFLLIITNHIHWFIYSLCSGILAGAGLSVFFSLRSRPYPTKGYGRRYEYEPWSLIRSIRRTRATFAGISGAVFGTFFGALCFSVVGLLLWDRQELRLAIGPAILAGFAVYACRLVFRLIQMANFMTLFAITKRAPAIAAYATIVGLTALAVVSYPVELLLGYTLIAFAWACLLGMALGLLYELSFRPPSLPLPRHIGTFDAVADRRRIERDENIRIDVRERRMRQREYY